MNSKKRSLYFFEFLTKIMLISLPFILIFISNKTLSIYRNNINNNIHVVIRLIINIVVSMILFIIILKVNKKLNYHLNESQFKSFSKLINKRKLVKITIIILSIFSFFIFTVYQLQDQVIFHPNYSYNSAVYTINQGYESINIDNKYYGYAKKTTIDNAPSIIYFAGNGESAANFFRKNHETEIINYYDNYNLFIVDYPSYGLSKGKLNETSIFEMALSTFDYISNLDYVNNEEIVVMGFSLGTGVASYVAKQRDVSKLILIAPYNNLTDAMNQYLPIFYGPFKYLVKNKFNSSFHLTNLNTNILMIYSLDDEIISSKLTEKLFTNINSTNNVSKIMFNDLTHNQLLYDERILFLINIFIG